MADSTRRFSDRVENYIKWRPSYPELLFRILADETNLKPSSEVADIGSGTGISAELFLKQGHTVHGVEPNREMREAAARLLAGYPLFHSLNGTAEATTLPDASVDLIVAAQSFHWFDPDRTLTEFTRILRRGGWCLLMWNSRRTDSTPFLREYESLLNQFGTDYQQIRHENIDANSLQKFFSSGTYKLRRLDNEQRFDWEGLKGRVLSSSYVPTEGHPHHEPLMTGLKAAFDKFQKQGQVCFEYDAELHLGQL